MPLLENFNELFMDSEDLSQVRRDFYHWKGDLMMDTRTVLNRYGTTCPQQGCHRCTNPDCPYAEYIRDYWNYPRCD